MFHLDSSSRENSIISKIPVEVEIKQHLSFTHKMGTFVSRLKLLTYVQHRKDLHMTTLQMMTL
jgi:hypothetical protein